MDNMVREVVQEAFPERTIETVQSQNTRPGNETAFVTFADTTPAYVKTATDTARRLARETAAIRYAEAHCPVGTPTVVAADPTDDRPYLVTEPLPGTILNDPWTDGADREQLLWQVGFTIAGVHEAEFEQAGVITGDGADGLDLKDSTWTETLCETIEWRASDWFADRFADMPDRLVETIRDCNPTLEDTTPTLLHGDPSRINFHLDPNGLLDWERALVGDPAFGLVEATFHHLAQPDVDEADRATLTDALHDGYRERAGDLPAGLDRYQPLYRAISYLLAPQAFEDWASGAEQPKDELAADVRDEFDTRLSQAREELT